MTTDRVGPRLDITGRAPYEEYHRLRFEAPVHDPHGVVPALVGGRRVGRAATSDRRTSGFVRDETTGVRACHRGRGSSIAMETFGIGCAGIRGVSTVRTPRHPANASAIGVNRMLGSVDADR